MALIVDNDLTFTQVEADAIIKEYVCAICNSNLHIQRIPNHERVFILCPAHDNVCICGRVMHSTVNIRVSSSKKNYYAALAAHPALYGGIWKQGIPRADAEEIAHKSVCSLCGFDLHVYLTSNPEIATVKCGFCKTNVGLSGYGFTNKATYTHVPPIKIREYLKKRALSDLSALPIVAIDPYSFEKIGSVSVDIASQIEESGLHLYGRTVQVSENIKRVYGNSPKADDIKLLFTSLQESFTQSLDCYNRGALFAKATRGDEGYQWNYFRDPYTQEIEIRGSAARTVTGFRMMQKGVDQSAVLYTSSKGQEYTLRNTGRLRFVLPGLTQADGTPIPGYFEMSITENLEGIESAIRNAKEIAFDNGLTLSEIPMSIFVQDGKPKLQLDLSQNFNR
mgnify:CR=1 FL=1